MHKIAYSVIFSMCTRGTISTMILSVRRLAIVLCLLVLSVPLLVSANIVPCSGVDMVNGEPVPTCQACNLVELANNITNWIVGIFTVIFAIIFIVAGWRMVASTGNVSEKEAGKKMITNAFIGFVIVLAGWLIMDFFMKSLLGNDDGSIGTFGPWNEIKCVEQKKSEVVYNIGNAEDARKTYGDSTTEDLGSAGTYEEGDCSPENLKNMGMNDTQSKVFSCIAEAESGCNNNAQNKTSSARGIFQITRGWNDTCHNLNLSSCEAAAKTAGWSGGNLNCSRAFGAGGKIKSGQEELANICNVAASNQQCNVDAALCLYKNGGYGHWTGTKSNPHKKQIACVQKYAN
jgi:hypothetical protein